MCVIYIYILYIYIYFIYIYIYFIYIYILFDPRVFKSSTKFYQEHDWAGPNADCFLRR